MGGSLNWIIHHGDAMEVLKTLPDESVHTCVTSPPYWGLRDYGVPGQLGLEPTPDEYVGKMVAVFREVRRVLRADGTCWINLGDSYWGSGKGLNGDGTHSSEHSPTDKQFTNKGSLKTKAGDYLGVGRQIGLKPKDLCGIPWLLAFALRSDGWYLRQDIIWAKPNPMPESVTDRCTKAHEYLFLLSKSARYYFDQEAILEPCSLSTHARLSQDVQNQIGSERANGGAKTNGNMKAVGRHLPGNKTHKGTTAYENGAEEHRTKAGLVDYAQKMRKLAEPGSGTKNNSSFDAAMAIMPEKRNKRSVWEVTTQGYSEAHFATFPPKLVEPCILAGCPENVCSKCGTVIDRRAIIDARSRTYGNGLPVLREKISEATEPENTQQVLQQEVYGESADNGEADCSLRMVREACNGRPQGATAEILQQSVCLDLHGEEPEHDKGAVHNQSRLCGDSQTGSPEREQRRVCDGAQASDGAHHRTLSSPRGSSSPQERNQSGQQARESGTDDEARPRQAEQASPSRENKLPSLPRRNSSHSHCPHCHADLTIPGAISSGTVLDPFSGAGTTGLVATRLGRNYAGIELNADYIRMAERRIEQDAPLFNTVGAL